MFEYETVCSGIGAPEYGFRNLPWQCTGQSEIAPFPRAVLKHHYPETELHGDFTKIGERSKPLGLLVGGTPCQSFSIAGQRAGLDDPRGHLALEYLALARRRKAQWLLFENVPGLLSHDGGRTFGTFLRFVAECGYGFAYRVLDAQYWGLAQQRQRVFVVGYLGDWRPAAAVLFEPQSLYRHPAAGKCARQVGDIAGTLAARTSAGGGLGTDFDLNGGIVAKCLTTGTAQRYDTDTDTMIVAPLTRSQYADNASQDSKLAPVAFNWQSGGDQRLGIGEQSSALSRSQVPAALYYSHDYNQDRIYSADSIAPAVTASDSGGARNVLTEMAVRRLTPRECERLQGFPDDWTRVPYRSKPATDSPRYKAIGNSMATPVLTWIGERIQAVEETASDPATLRAAPSSP